MTDGLVLIHGWPLDASMWDRQVATFSDRVPVLAPNMPGFGGAAPAGDVMTMDRAADLVDEAMGAAGMERGVIVGLSMGGYVAFALWRRHRERFLALGLASTRSPADDEAGVERRKAVAAKVREEGTQSLVDAPPPLLSEHASTELWDEVKAIVARQPAEAIAAAALGMAERPDSTPLLPEIDVPTFVIVGTDDTMIPPDAQRPMVGAIGADAWDIEGAGHLCNMETPREFDAAVSDLLDRAGL